ncbi:MAG: NAD-dependent epimerase/dehydratase family protein [Cyclobacteriaceae bacterium]
MVVGNGLLAKAFKSFENDDEVVIFASGVSNSSETKLVEYDREKNLLIKTLSENPALRLVYFSTCSIYDSFQNGNEYVRHKLRMEQEIINRSNNYLILRLSNVVGLTNNRNTLFNYLANCVKERQNIEVWSGATRNLLDIDHAFEITKEIINKSAKSNIYNIANVHDFKVIDILSAIEKHFNLSSNSQLVDKGVGVSIDLSAVQQLIPDYDKYFAGKEDYLLNLLAKYYSKS